MLFPMFCTLVSVGALKAPDSLHRLIFTGEFQPQMPFQQSVHTTIEALKRYKPTTMDEQIERLMLEINGEMEKFERLGPLFGKINSASGQFSDRDRLLASGRPSQELHERLMTLNTEYDKKRPGDEARLKPLIETFLNDLRTHVLEVTEVIPRMARESGGVVIPPGLPKGGIHFQSSAQQHVPHLSTRDVSTPHGHTTPGSLGGGRPLSRTGGNAGPAGGIGGMPAGIGGGNSRIGVAPSGVRPNAPNFAGMQQQRQRPPLVEMDEASVVEGIRAEMQRFDGIKPLFGRVSPASLQDVSPYERQILSGIGSQKLHERFLSLQNSNDGSQLAAFLQDLRAHVDEATILLQRHTGARATISQDSGGQQGNIAAGPPLMTNSGGPLRAAADPEDLEMLFKEIQEAMGRFERIAPRFQKLPDLASCRVSEHERAVLSGEVSNALHERFLLLQHKIQHGRAGGDMSHSFTRDTAEFLDDLKAHVAEATELLNRYTNPTPGGARSGFVGPPIQVSAGAGTIPGQARVQSQTQPPSQGQFPGSRQVPPQMGSGDPGNLDTEARNIFNRIQTQMAIFEKIAQLFQQLPSPQVLATLGFSPAEYEILTGKPSQLLHERFLAIQDKEIAPDLLPTIRQYVQDLEAHVTLAGQVVPRAVSANMGGIGSQSGVPVGVASGQTSGIPGQSAGVAAGNTRIMSGIPGRPVGVASGGAGQVPGQQAGAMSGNGGLMTGIPGQPAGVAPGNARLMAGIPGQPAGVASGSAGQIPGRPVGVGASNARQMQGDIPARPINQIAGIPGRAADAIPGNLAGSIPYPTNQMPCTPERPCGVAPGNPYGGMPRSTGGIPGHAKGAAGQPRSATPHTANIGGMAAGHPPVAQQQAQQRVVQGAALQPPPSGAAIGAGSSIGSSSVERSFQEIQVLMKVFETIKPKFARLPSPQQLKAHVSADDLHLLSGQASEALHHRFLRLQNRAQSAVASPQDQMSITRDAEVFVGELQEHVKQMERVLAVDYSAIAAGVVPAGGQSASPVLTREQILKELPQIEEELKSNRKRFKKTLRSTEKIMLESEPNRNPRVVNSEMNRLMHMMGSLYSSITSSIAILRKELLTGSMTEKLHERLEAMMLEMRRYKDTIRDLEGESVKKDGVRPAALDILKPQGILTSKPVNLSNAKMPTDEARKASFNIAGQGA
eukprot:GEMP01006892.1.p1 GENE.GEMP01006892.1~~GEMP01006892.1.p1  ORF type:complete len:1179 (+),score=254.16 GEMP01006892.1:44-3580(+)